MVSRPYDMDSTQLLTTTSGSIRSSFWSAEVVEMHPPVHAGLGIGDGHY